jgi:hypothetical protein
MNKYAIVESGVVVNVALWDGDIGTWSPAEGQTAVLLPDDSVGIGHSYAGGVFTSPPAPAAPVIPPPTYQELRAAAYPPAADYLDGIVKGDTAQVQAYIDACLAVKAKYPKS